METVRNRFYVLELDEATDLLAFIWTEKTAEMTDDDYMSAWRQFAMLTVLHRVARCLVDVRALRYRVCEELEFWRQRKIVPIFHIAGVEKYAYVVPGDGDEPGARVLAGEKFQTRRFASLASARVWLAESVGNGS